MTIKERIQALALATTGAALPEKLCEVIADEINFRVKTERDRCKELAHRCEDLYRRRGRQDRKEADPKAPLIFGVYRSLHEKSSCDKATACEYVQTVIEGAYTKTDGEDFMPMPY